MGGNVGNEELTLLPYRGFEVAWQWLVVCGQRTKEKHQDMYYQTVDHECYCLALAKTMISLEFNNSFSKIIASTFYDI